MLSHESNLCALGLLALFACDAIAGRIDQACSSNSDCASTGRRPVRTSTTPSDN